MLREKIAAIIGKPRMLYVPGIGLNVASMGKEGSKEITDEIHKEYMAWFREEIEKLGVISDEEIIKILWPLFSGVCNRIPSEITLTADDIGIANRRIAQAQLDYNKKQLLAEIEAKA